jgi:hypothetical protein
LMMLVLKSANSKVSQFLWRRLAFCCSSKSESLAHSCARFRAESGRGGGSVAPDCAQRDGRY